MEWSYGVILSLLSLCLHDFNTVPKEYRSTIKLSMSYWVVGFWGFFNSPICHKRNETVEEQLKWNWSYKRKLSPLFGIDITCFVMYGFTKPPTCWWGSQYLFLPHSSLLFHNFTITNPTSAISVLIIASHANEIHFNNIKLYIFNNIK